MGEMVPRRTSGCYEGSMTYDVAAVRAHYPALAGGEAFFDGPGGTQVPRPVVDAVASAMASPVSNRGPAHETPTSRRRDRG